MDVKKHIGNAAYPIMSHIVLPIPLRCNVAGLSFFGCSYDIKVIRLIE